MSETANEPADTDESVKTDGTETVNQTELRDRIAHLEVQNQRLRTQYEQQQHDSYRKTAVALAGVGVLAVGGAVLFVSVRELLVALAAAGFFAAALTYFVTPDQVITSGTGESVYDTHATNTGVLVDQLGLNAARVYLPTDGNNRARLFIPQNENFAVPSSADLTGTLVVTDDERERGISLVPTGASLLDAFERSLVEPLGSSPETAAQQLSDGLTDALELAETVEVMTDAAAGQASFGVVNPTWGPIDRIDHPIASFLGTGLAVAIDTHVEVTVVAEHSGPYNVLVRVDWDNSPD